MSRPSRKKRKRSSGSTASGGAARERSASEVIRKGDDGRFVIYLGLVLVILVGAVGFFSNWTFFLSVPGDEPVVRLRDDNSKTFEPPPPREEFLQVASRIANSINPHLGTLQVPQLQEQLRLARANGQQTGNLHLELCSQLLRLGDTGGAVEQIEEAFALARATGGFQPAQWSSLHERRALVYLRKAEVANCIERHNRECCIFPLTGGGVHAEKEPISKAKESLLEILKIDSTSLSARWLLNLCSMALGDYPEGVPESFLIPPEAFESDYDIGRFVDVAPQLGMDALNLCGGVIVEDFNGDDLLDIVASTYDPLGPLQYFLNRGNGTFQDASAASQLDQQLGGLNLLATDYDNDGDTDIFVLRGAWLFDDGQIRNSLLRNNGDGTFTDATYEAGLALPARPTQAAVWGDFDNDGDLDVFVGNESRVELERRSGNRLGEGGDYPSQLFRNNGDGTFTDIAEQAGVTNDMYCKAVTAGDFDNDGDLDLYVSNLGKNRLFRNNGDATFTDVAEQLKVTAPENRSFATWFFDYNNDGWLDLFVAAYEADIGDIAADFLGQEHDGVSPCLYLNDGKGGFTDIAGDAGIHHPYLPMGANFGDLDNDGWLDVYLATGDPSYQTLTPNVMLRNNAANGFQDVTTSGGFGHLQKGHGVAFADIDNDGDQDIYHQLGGFYPGDRFHNALFKNPGHGNQSVVIELVGTQTCRAAYGARLRVVLQTDEGQRTIHRAVGSVSSFGGSPARQEIGLGKATQIVRVEIDWPISKTTQVITDVPMGAMIRITEGAADFEPVQLRRFDLP